MMMVPRKNNFDLWEDIFKDPFFNYDDNKIMKTDIKEHKDSYSIIVDLPGYEKDNIKIDINDGYLTIDAIESSNEEEKEKGKFVRKERYYGECKRSFYVGEEIEAEDVKASFKNGTLKLVVSKKEPKKEIENKKYIQIEG